MKTPVVIITSNIKTIPTNLLPPETAYAHATRITRGITQSTEHHKLKKRVTHSELLYCQLD